MIGIQLNGCVDCSFGEVYVQGVAVGMELHNTTNVRIGKARFETQVAVKGRGVKGFEAKDVEHIYYPAKSSLSLAIARAIHGNV